MDCTFYHDCCKTTCALFIFFKYVFIRKIHTVIFNNCVLTTLLMGFKSKLQQHVSGSVLTFAVKMKVKQSFAILHNTPIDVYVCMDTSVIRKMAAFNVIPLFHCQDFSQPSRL